MRVASTTLSILGVFPYTAGSMLLFTANIGLVVVLGWAGAVLVWFRAGLAGIILALAGLLGYFSKEGVLIPGQPGTWPLLLLLAGILALVVWIRQP